MPPAASDDKSSMATQQAMGMSAEGTASAEDVRRSRRETLVTAATLWPSATPRGAGVRVFVSNISLDGLAFRARTIFMRDTVHYVRLVAGPLRLEGQIRIAWCRQHDANTYDTGAEFVEQ
jgi:hypothetical protein